MTVADRLREQAKELRLGAQAFPPPLSALLLDLLADAQTELAFEHKVTRKCERGCSACALLRRIEEIA